MRTPSYLFSTPLYLVDVFSTSKTLSQLLIKYSQVGTIHPLFSAFRGQRGALWYNLIYTCLSATNCSRNYYGSPCGIRTHIIWMRTRPPKPLEERTRSPHASITMLRTRGCPLNFSVRELSILLILPLKDNLTKPLTIKVTRLLTFNYHHLIYSINSYMRANRDSGTRTHILTLKESCH